ncbi:MAG TPA: hypothetical protein VN554_00955 [Verrucomicrobiae bacterium]|nr:hypothetical protein [Verrucomicrobiae bacterium]
MNVLPNIFPRDPAARRAALRETLIRREARIGGRLFGTPPEGREREFFCLDKHTWIWRETWITAGYRRTVTTRYELQPGGVTKLQDGQGRQLLSHEEARNLRHTIQLYRRRVVDYYRRQLQTA